MKNTFSKSKQLYSKVSNSKFKVNRTGAAVLVFTPAVFFTFLAIAVILAPKLILFIFSMILLFFAACAAFVAYKFMQLKKQFNKVKSNIFAGNMTTKGFAMSSNPKDYRAQIFVEKAVENQQHSSVASLEELLDGFEGQPDLKSKLEKILSDTKLMTEDEEGNIIEIIEGKKVLLH